jgi:hypothetical protein
MKPSTNVGARVDGGASGATSQLTLRVRRLKMTKHTLSIVAGRTIVCILLFASGISSAAVHGNPKPVFNKDSLIFHIQKEHRESFTHDCDERYSVHIGAWMDAAWQFGGDGNGRAISDIGADELIGGSTNLPPVAHANGPYTVEINGVLALEGTGSFDPDPGDAIVSYDWDLDYDGTFDIMGNVLTIPSAVRESFGINTVGNYPITLQVTDNHGATDTVTAVLEVISPPGTIAVTNINDSGTGSLREAINSANANLGDTIIFSISGTPPYTITPLSPLPEITAPVILDGTTQPGFVDTPVIEIDGSNAGLGTDGLVISASNSGVRGVNIHSFDGDGITLSNSIGNNVIELSFIGTDPSGNYDMGNGQNGVNIISSPGNRVLNSMISGNDANGIRIANVNYPVNPTFIQGNNIGVNLSGTVPLGNTSMGLRIENSLNIMIGGMASGEGNIIGANSDGVSIVSSTDITVYGNRWGENIYFWNLGAGLGCAGGSLSQ